MKFYYAAVDEMGVLCVNQLRDNDTEALYDEEMTSSLALSHPDAVYFAVEPGVKAEMTEQERAIGMAADEADMRTDLNARTGPGVWHEHFINALHEQGWILTREGTES